MIELPENTPISGWGVIHKDYGGHQVPETGGEVTRVSRLGNKTGVSVTLAPMIEDEGRIVVNRLIKAKSAGLRLKWQMNGFEVGNVGSPRINGAGQSGKNVLIDGLAANYQFKEGQPLSIFQDGRNYIYFVDIDINANSAGQVNLPINPMLRAPTIDNGTVFLDDIHIDGYITGDETQWQQTLAGHIEIAFEIMEFA